MDVLVVAQEVVVEPVHMAVRIAVQEAIVGHVKEDVHILALMVVKEVAVVTNYYEY
jgi:hypothetical protein